MKRILAGLDSSPHSEGVAARAAEIAKLTGAELYLLRAIGLPGEIPQTAYRGSPEDVLALLRNVAALDLERIAGTLQAEVVTHVLVRVGVPWAAICEAAAEHNVDLVVIGSHGHRLLDSLLGTTAAKVVNHCERSVLVVRERVK